MKANIDVDISLGPVSNFTSVLKLVSIYRTFPHQTEEANEANRNTIRHKTALKTTAFPFQEFLSKY